MGKRVYTIDSLPIVQDAITLRQIRDTRTNLNQYFLTEAQDEKFRALRASKKIERLRPNGEIYYYSEGAMAYPDNLDLPGRTMLTSEASINRSTHVIEDLETQPSLVSLEAKCEYENVFIIEV